VKNNGNWYCLYLHELLTDWFYNLGTGFTNTGNIGY